MASYPTLAQNVQFTQGAVGSGLDNAIQIPVASYPGRGAAGLPVTLYYSSRVWRIGYVKSVQANSGGLTQSVAEAVYAEHSNSGWTTSLDLPKIEWPKQNDLYWYDGKPYHNSVPPYTVRVANVFIHMPDGSTHELRKSDQVYADSGVVDVLGTFYAVDGSRLRYDSTGAATGTLYMPDGSRYELNGATARFVDRNGNALNYDASARQWADPLGRAVGAPWPASPQAGQDYRYTPPGYAQPYVFKWKLLSDVLTTPDADGNTPQTRAMSSHYLPQPDQAPSNWNQGNFPQRIPAGTQSLFFSDYGDESADNPAPTYTYVVGRGQDAARPFDPVVLSEVVLPNGLSYRFTYNIYGEIDKAVYPTGGYERGKYDTVPASGDLKPPYTEGSRGLKFRRVSPNGTGGTDEAQWTYEGGGGLVKVTAPDGTRTESYRYNFFDPVPKNFGHTDSRNGLTYDERVYDAAGAMLRRTLTDWAQTSRSYAGPQTPCCGITPTGYTAYRNPRPAKSVSLILDTGGDALSNAVTYDYDTTYEMTTGLDRTGMAETQFTAVDRNTATTGAITEMPAGPAVSSTQTVYVSDPAYRDPSSHDRYMLGLVSSVVLKDSAGQVVSKTETFYDEAGYPLLPPYGDLGTDANYVDTGTPLRGNPTTVRRYSDIAAGSYLETHAQFDQYGNPVYFWDERGVQSQKEYAAAYRHAYPTQTTTAAPDPSGQHGSSAAFTTSSTYDAATGHVLTATDADGQVTSFSYQDNVNPNAADPMNRLRKVTRPDGGWTKSDYNDAVGNLYVHTETALDESRSTHAYQFYDGLGRAAHSLASEIGSNYVGSDITYDSMGRVSRVSNPYRTQTFDGASRGGYWTTNTYDALGRVRQVTQPDSTVVTNEYEGVYTTVTDQAGRKRRQKTDALGHIVRVDEPDASGNLDAGDRNHPFQPSFYEYDALGNVVRTSQGLTQPGADPENQASYIQHRYFKYDALCRPTHEKQAEQAATIPDQPGGPGVWSRKLTYDETVNGNFKGLLTTAEDARHVVSTFRYDQLGRPYQTTYSDGTPTLTSRYDQARTDAPPPGEQAVTFYNKGRLTELTTAATADAPQTQQLYDHDLTGRARRQRQVVGANTYELRYAYNLGGDLVSERYPSGRVVSYGYDAAARLASVSSGATAYASGMSYKPFGGLESMTLGNGATYAMSYDDARLQLASLTLTQGGSVVQKYEYKYGRVNMADGTVDMSKNAGQIATIDSTVGPQRQWEQRFRYDALGRLSSAGEYGGGTLAQSYLLNYDYDVYGNRYQKQSRNANNPVSQSWVEDGSFSPATNRFTSGVTYDDAGNVASDARFRQRSFQYDADNRQRQSSNLDGTGAVQSVYDGAGRRVAVKSAGQVTNVMVYDAAGDLVAEYGGAVYTNGTRYVTGDHQGSERVVMSGGAVVSRHDYLPFGEEAAAGVGARTAAQGYSQPDGVREKYAGMEGDDSTGMSHTPWREYDSLSARWTAPDPYGGSMSLSSPQSFNRYAYVNDDPVNNVDPTGLMLSDIGVYQTESSAVALRLERARDQYTKRYVDGQTGRAQSEQRYQQFNSSFGGSSMPAGLSSFGGGRAKAGAAATGTGNPQEPEGPAVSPADIEAMGDPPELATVGGVTILSTDERFNCMAWGLGYYDRWLQPGPDGYGIATVYNKGQSNQRVELSHTEFRVSAGSLPGFLGAQRSLEGAACQPGKVKIAVFEDSGDPNNWHVERQRSGTGHWTSKFGVDALVEHILNPRANYNLMYPPHGRVKTTYYCIPDPGGN